MEYYVTKQDHRNEWRVYLDDNITTDDTILYKGHKLGLETKDMVSFLEYRQEKSTGKLFFLNYKKVKEMPDTKDSSMWFEGNGSTIDRIVQESWLSLEKKIAEEGNKFRKVTVTRAPI